MRDAAAQTAAWEAQKTAERAARAETGSARRRAGRPARPRPRRQADRPCRRVGFDWPDADAVLTKLDEEVAELRAELSEPIRSGWRTRWATCCSCSPTWRASLIWIRKPACTRPT